MADNTILTSQRLWSEEVAIAAASDPDSIRTADQEPGYEFSNGRKFFSGNGANVPTTTP